LKPLLSVQEAQNRILSFFKPVESEMTPVVQSSGRLLAEDIQAPDDLPQFHNSSMDGFAIRTADTLNATPENPVSLQIVADIPAGAAHAGFLLPGQAARIMTGAPLPDGADAVTPIEDTNFSPALEPSSPAQPVPQQVLVFHPASQGANVRPRGSDIRQGQLLLQTGRKLQPQDIGLLASTGRATVKVCRKPRVALFSSGDELVQPGQPLGPGKIYDSNQYVLASLLEREGAQVIRLGTAPDDPQQIEALLRKAAAEKVDLIVTSAGVSVGAFDFVRQVIETHGSLNFWRVDMRPGKPLAFGAFMDIPLIGLPGNPVSAFIGCLVFVLPALYLLSGRSQTSLNREKAILAETVTSDGRESYLRAVVTDKNGRMEARLTGHQGSGNLFSLVQANALLIVPSGVKSLPSDSEVEIWFFNRE